MMGREGFVFSLDLCSGGVGRGWIVSSQDVGSGTEKSLTINEL